MVEQKIYKKYGVTISIIFLRTVEQYFLRLLFIIYKIIISISNKKSHV